MKPVAILLATFLFSLMSMQISALEEPEYAVIGQLNDIEFRKYSDYLVAETVVRNTASRDQAANIAFRRLFKYISGANTSSSKIAMTAPVQQREQGVKIDMTAPVKQKPRDGGWAIAFVIPREFDATTVPAPTHPDVSIRQVQGDIIAALRYSGRWTDRNVDNRKRQLLETLQTENIEVRGTVMTAYYNSPFSLPFARRNEVLVSVAKPPSVKLAE